ncbi:MAG: hypothetical protein AAB482_00595 [Patescibacteria group bacterium]
MAESLQSKILNIEAELNIVKRTLKKSLDFNIDERNWRAVKSTAKKTRKQLSRDYYAKN